MNTDVWQVIVMLLGTVVISDWLLETMMFSSLFLGTILKPYVYAKPKSFAILSAK